MKIKIINFGYKGICILVLKKWNILSILMFIKKEFVCLYHGRNNHHIEVIVYDVVSFF